LIRKAFPLLALLSLVCPVRSAFAQTDTPPTAFDKQLHKIDLSINGVGIYNSTVTGNVVPNMEISNQGLSITQFGSNTAGALVSLQYIAKPYFGLELNYGYARYTENYEGAGIVYDLGISNFQVQTKVNEYTFGYVATPPHPIFGFQPFLGAGFGTMGFKPTAGGGQELPEKARAVYYYALGLQKDLNPHFGLKLGFRELFFIDPDFGQNYLTILKHANTYEPMAGFYFRY
jgi:putative cofactor-binding repeat protein